MADSILRLRVDSAEYDSKIKRAAQGLLQMEKECRKAGKSMNDMDKDQKQFVQSLGSMQTVSQTTRGKIGELSGAFVELRSQYNRLTEEERTGDFGRVLSESLEQLKTRVAEAKAELKDIQKELDGSDSVEGGGGGFLSGIGGKMSGALQVFAGNMLTKAAGAVANLGSEMADMVKQGIALAKQGEGIRIAFERLGRGDILDGLREATHGTVTDLELMKAAVKFNDFRLPVEELGTMLAFAQQKAKDTGQSVDYMVDSIVTGLGRKSLMILDNLGLSAAEIKDKMAETGDMTKAVGAIIREQMAKAGDYVETAADRAAQANVSLQNKMEELGRKFAPLQEASNSLWTSMKIGILDVVGGPLARLLNGLTEVGRMMNAYNKMGGSDKVGRMTAELAGASEQDRQSIYQQRQEELWRYINPREQQIKDIRAWQSGQRGEALQGRIGAIREEYGMLDTAKIQAEVDAAKKMLADYQQAAKQILSPVKPVIETSGAEQSIDSLKGKLAELEAQRKKAIAAGDTDLSKNLAKQITQTKADIKLLGGSVSTPTTTKEVTIQQKISELEKEALTASEQRREEIQATIQELDRELAKQKEIVAALHDVPADAVGKAYRDMLRGARVQLPDEAPLSTARVGIMPGYLTQPVTDAPTALQAAQYEAAKAVKAEDMKVDTSTLQSILRNALQEGIDTATLNLDGVAEQIGRGINVPDETWQGILDEYNALREAIGQDPIEIDFKTGKLKELKENSKGLAGDWQNASSAIQAVGSALGSIEDPAAKVAGIVAQAIATVALTFSKSLAGTVGPWDWIAAAAAGTATMVSTIATIKSSTKGGFAEGGIVPGNSFSGDNLRISDYGINSGELILSRSQQDSIAAQLTNDDGQASGGIPYVTGETLFLGVSNTLRRQGRGEIVTTSMLRRAGIRL